MRRFLSFLHSWQLNPGGALLLCAVFAVTTCGGSDKNDIPAEVQSYRTIDGNGNNLKYPEMNKAVTQLVRLAPAAYADGISSFSGPDRPNPRRISNIVHAQKELIANPDSTTNFMWLWGQFIDHDITFSDNSDEEPANIKIPRGDEILDPQGTGEAEMFFNRAINDPATGGSGENPRQQMNEVTGWIDASTVYGSDAKRADALRTNDGTGRLKTSEGNFLPRNERQFPNSRFALSVFFFAGDERANENLGILSIQALFMREHNRLAEEIAMSNPSLSGEEIYQRARRIVGAHIQAITYNEFLPLLLGPDALPPYSGYDDSINSGVVNSFSSAAFRVGHTFLDPKIPLVDTHGEEVGAVALKDAFFVRPDRFAELGIDPIQSGIDLILRGFATRKHQRVDPLIIDDVRNFLFVDSLPTGTPRIQGAGLDLVSLNIQRGRDHGLPDYNEMREALGLGRNESFSDINKDPEVQRKLREVYETTDDMDIWSAGIAEGRHGESMLGELFHTIVSHQFRVLRDGDRFWYQRILSAEELRRVEETKLADIIRRNTGIAGEEIGDNVFKVAPE